MSYKDFKDISDVCEAFDCDYEKKKFVKEKEIRLNEYLIETIKENLKDNSCFINEYVICEDIIKPIIKPIAKAANLPIWSHVQFDVDKERGLTGVPDYLFAFAKRGMMQFKSPIACLGEAKKDDFTGGWGQTAAEMIAAQIANKNKDVTIYGLVTNGTFWKFGKLENKKFTMEESHVSVENLNTLFNILNWFFCEARKSADILLEIETKEKEKQTSK